MGRSTRLRLCDVEAVFQFIQECRELWADADAWQRHLTDGACRLTGTAVGIYLEQRYSREHKSLQILDLCDAGWRDASAHDSFRRLFTDNPDLVRIMPGCARLAAAAFRRAHATALRPQIVPDDRWYASRIFNEYRRPANVDGYALSYCHNPRTGNQIMLCVSQDLADPAPTPRARTILALLNRQLTPLVGTVLTTHRHRGIHGLPPRLRQTLERLLAGEAEKQIAARLGISRNTVHEHIGRLYRHFGFADRSELMAHFLHRRPSPRSEH